MSVLNRKELEDSPLADLHQIASELGLEGYRSKRKADLIATILGATGAADEPAEVSAPATGAEPDEEEDTSEDTSEGTSDDTSEGTSDDEPDDVDEPDDRAADTDEAVVDEPDEVPAEEVLERPSRRGRRGGRGRRAAAAEEPSRPSAAAEEEPSRPSAATEEEPEVVEDEISDEELATGVLDVLANGSGFVRVDPTGQSRGDVYVSPAQIRRCELRAGDEVSGPARSARRNERHPSLVRIETVNGAAAEPAEERPWFGDLTPVFPSRKLNVPKSLKDVPLGRGSRVAIAGPPGAGATTLLRELAGELAGDPELALQVVLAGVRPEEVTEWRRNEGLNVAGGSFDRSPDAQAQAAELAVERAKRRVERGGHAAVLIDSLEALPGSARRRIFGAGRATEEGGTLTVIAVTGSEQEALRWATTRVVLEPGGKLSADSGTVRADALS
jgi:transcription termination factor Rho